MTEREAHIAFNMIPTVGAVTVRRLAAAAGGSAAAAYARFPDKKDWEGKEPQWEKEIERAAKGGVTIVTELDAAYPPLLRETASPPLALYVAGDAAALSRPSVALVGTRAATAYGRETAERLGAELAQRGWAVVSGLAEGIDAAAHKGALLGGGVTIGVLGGALDRFYPENNRRLARDIVAKGGCVASEFPFGRKPDAQTFPQRNRIVSGLSRGVVAVECPVQSGTLITCSRAAEQGRPVMAVPGRVDWRVAGGCLKLIRSGATLVRCADDILEAVMPLGQNLAPPGGQAPSGSIPPGGQSPSQPTPPGGRRTGFPAHTHEADAPVRMGETVAPARAGEAVAGSGRAHTFSLEEARVMRAVPEEGAYTDAVARAAGLSAARTNAILIGLRMKGRVRFLPGNRVASVTTTTKGL